MKNKIKLKPNDYACTKEGLYIKNTSREFEITINLPLKGTLKKIKQPIQ